MRTVITGQVDQTVVLGQDGYGSAVTVAGTGAITPAYVAFQTYYGGIYIPASIVDARVTNHGSIGATNSYGYNEGGHGGVGVHFAASGHLTNTGSIAGGNGGGGAYVGGPGGIGVFFGGAGHVTNSGIIQGGNAVPFSENRYYGGLPGGVGIVFAAGASLANSGTIAGGVGGGEYYGGSGGNGIDLSGSGHLSNTGTISGGAALSTSYQPYTAGTGVDLTGGGTLTNDGAVFGGAGGSASSYRSGYRSGGGVGGEGVIVGAGSHLTNNGIILAGGGGSSLIAGGTGAVAVYASGRGMITNSGTIIGGVGGSVESAYRDLGGAGGLGVNLSAGSQLTNDGMILGGAGGKSSMFGGRGAEGIDVTGNSLVTNLGTIIGGVGGAGYAGRFGAGYGGDGVLLDGGTLVNAGVIVGGKPGAGGHGHYAAGYAVRFGQAASTLVVDPGAVFNGGIYGYARADDTLLLAGTTPGSLSGFGTSIIGLTTIREEAHAHWTLNGSTIAADSVQIGADASLTLSGAVSTATIAFLGGGGETLRLGTPAHVTSTLQGFSSSDVIDLERVQATSLTYAAGTLTLFDGGSVVDTLTLLGHYMQADFSLKTDGHSGTDVVLSGYSSIGVPFKTLVLFPVMIHQQ